MGTSKVYGSPKWPGVNSAVGNALSSASPTGQGISGAVGAFAKAYKNYLTSTSGGQSGSGSAGTLPHERARGGGSGGTARLRSARSGARLANFLGIAGRSGLNAALQQFDLSNLRDKPLADFLDAIAERLSREGGLLDDDALNRAMSETINELAQDINSVDELDALLSGGDIDIEAILQTYYSNILTENFEQKEYSVVREKIPREETDSFFTDARKVIRAIVRDELSSKRDLTKIDWNSLDGQRIADEINQEVLDILIS